MSFYSIRVKMDNSISFDQFKKQLSDKLSIKFEYSEVLGKDQEGLECYRVGFVLNNNKYSIYRVMEFIQKFSNDQIVVYQFGMFKSIIDFYNVCKKER